MRARWLHRCVDISLMELGQVQRMKAVSELSPTSYRSLLTCPSPASDPSPARLPASADRPR